MNEATALTLIAIIAGATATVAVARYYYLRGAKRELSVYALNSKEIFAGVNTATRDKISVLLEDTAVQQPFQMTFVVINEGYAAIREIAEPLTLRIPKDHKILDVSVTSVFPKGRTVDVSDPTLISDFYAVQINFPLLNKDESFMLEVFSDGAIATKEAEFRIAAEDIPPVIKPLPLTETRYLRRLARQGTAFRSWKFALALSVFILACFVASFQAHSVILSDKAQRDILRSKIVSTVAELPGGEILGDLVMVFLGMGTLMLALLAIAGFVSTIEYFLHLKWDRRLPPGITVSWIFRQGVGDREA